MPQFLSREIPVIYRRVHIDKGANVQAFSWGGIVSWGGHQLPPSQMLLRQEGSRFFVTWLLYVEIITLAW